MILVDGNLLIYAFGKRFAQHEAAQAWLDSQLSESIRVGLPWTSLLSFVRITSNPALFSEAASVQDSWIQVRDWLSLPNVWVPCPTELHFGIVDRLLQTPGLTSRYVSDAHLAALAIEHGLTLCSSDTDFARFPGLKWENPLKPKT